LTSSGSRTRLEDCLNDIIPVCSELDAQIVIVRAFTDEELIQLRDIYPAVRFVSAPAGTAVEDLRALGMGATDGDIVVFSNDIDVTPAELADRFSGNADV
jgi:hypothetical protein